MLTLHNKCLDELERLGLVERLQRDLRHRQIASQVVQQSGKLRVEYRLTWFLS